MKFQLSFNTSWLNIKKEPVRYFWRAFFLPFLWWEIIAESRCLTKSSFPIDFSTVLMYSGFKMILLIIFLICVFITLVIGGLAGLSDIRSMTIPNSYSLYVIAAFFIAYGALYVGGQGDVLGSFLSHIISAVLAFVITLGLFAARVIGAGDSKFATACALWFGMKSLMVFLFYMALSGGVLGIVALYIKRKKPFKKPVEGSWVAQVQGGADKVPYGVAISFGMFVAFIQAGYFSSEVLGTFVASHVVEGGS